MTAYSDGVIFRHHLPEYDFGVDADEVVSFRLPNDENGNAMAGTLVGIGLQVTETFACDTTTAKIKLGTSANDDAYALLEIADGATDVDCFDQTDDTDAIIAASVAAGTLLQVTLVQADDAAADAGAGIPYFDFWLKSA